MFICHICVKKYKSQDTLNIHNKKYHNIIIKSDNITLNSSNNTIPKPKQIILNDSNDITLNSSNNTIPKHVILNDSDDITLNNTIPKHVILNDSDDITLNSSINVRMYKCAYCIKEYKHKQSKWTHEQTCKLINKTKTKDIINADLIAIEKMKLSLEIIKEEARILELKSKLEKSEKIDNITLKKLNRILQERNNRIKNSTINSHNTNTNIQNYITNNFQIKQLGKENIIDKLSSNEKKLIMNAKFCSFNKLKTKFLVY